MDGGDGDSCSQKENCGTGQRKILKASYSKQSSEKKEQQRPSEQTTSNGRTVTIHFDQLEVIRVLGEGAFGEVVLVVDRNDPSIAAAVKRISLRGMDNETAKQVRKEALLQRAVNKHKNVLKYISMRTIGDEMIELYLEYAGGGELFDQIEPDVGMEPIKAQCYFRQILNGLQYIHSNGIAHRDIKPENLLLDRNHVLKISDFGMATVFRHNGAERVLTTKCGTLPYAAPEVLRGHYKAEPIDVWSAGVVLVTMLVGELPWDAPTFDCDQYASFIKRDGDIERRPWCRMDNMELSLLRLILCEDVNKRGNITRIKKHPWYVADLSNQNLEERRKIYETGVPIRKISNAKKMKLESGVASTQPAQLHSMKSVRDQESVLLMNIDRARLPISCISQPVHYDLLSQPTSASQVGAYVNSPATLVRRMTRFCVLVSVPETLKNIEKAAEFCDCEFKMVTSHQVFLIPKKNQDLCLVATVYEMHENNVRKVLVDFRRSKGDGLEFKRMFVELKKALSKIICPNSHGWLEKHGLVCTKGTNDIIKEYREDILPTIEEESGQKDVEMN